MRLKHFQGRGVHGYLEFEVEFFPDVTMIHGINGAGKTTAVRAMMALISPDLQWLLSTDFHSLSVNVENDGDDITISARKEAESLFLSVSGSFDNYKQEIVSRLSLRYVDAITELNRARRMMPDEDFERHMPADTDFSAINMIRSLPTPTFLGLERTTLPPDYPGEETIVPDRTRRMHRYARLTMDASTQEALRLAKLAYEEKYLRARNALTARLKSNIVLSLFDKSANQGRYALPSKSDLKKYPQMMSRITSVLRDIQLVSEADIKKKVDPFFNDLIVTATNVVGAFDSDKASEDVKQKLFIKWIEMESPVRSIEKIVNLALEYDAAERSQFAVFSSYQDTINGFLRDSGKELTINSTGAIEIILPNGETGSVAQLSSGERQLFVLLTHLAFNIKTRDTDVLIIDEPELSLHLKWQQRFVDAITKTSPTTQLVLATHSPAIIGKLRKNCVSLNVKRGSAHL